MTLFMTSTAAYLLMMNICLPPADWHFEKPVAVSQIGFKYTGQFSAHSLSVAWTPANAYNLALRRSREDILLIVESVVIAPLQRRWAVVRKEALALASAAENEEAGGSVSKEKGTAYFPRLRKQLQDTILNWVEELSESACSIPLAAVAIFLYLALRRYAPLMA